MSVKVCPSCGSPHITAQVLTEAEINTNFQWEISYISPVELSEIMDIPENPVYCPRCEWEGHIKNMIVVPGQDASLYHEREAEDLPIPSTLGDVTISDDIVETKEFPIGSVVYIENELYVIIGKSTTNCAVTEFNPNTYQFVDKAIQNLELYHLTPVEQDKVPGGKYISLTYNQLVNTASVPDKE